MLDLSRKLKDELVLYDKTYSLDLSFDNVLRLFEMLSDEEIPELIKPLFALKILTKVNFESLSEEESIEIFKAIFDEHIQIKSIKDEIPTYDLLGNIVPRKKSKEENEQLYSVKYDGDYIYSSFMQAYGIDLLEEQGKLHWKKFNALLSGLPKNTKLMEIIQIRCWKPQKGDSTKYKEHMRKLQEEYKLPEF